MMKHFNLQAFASLFLSCNAALLQCGDLVPGAWMLYQGVDFDQQQQAGTQNSQAHV